MAFLAIGALPGPAEWSLLLVCGVSDNGDHDRSCLTSMKMKLVIHFVSLAIAKFTYLSLCRIKTTYSYNDEQ
jgi:hypothetical protein